LVPARYCELLLRIAVLMTVMLCRCVAIEVQTSGTPFGMMHPATSRGSGGGRSHVSHGRNWACLGDKPRGRCSRGSMDRPLGTLAARRLGRLAHAPLSARRRFSIRIRERVRDQHAGGREALGRLRRSVAGRSDVQSRAPARREGRNFSSHLYRTHRPQPGHRRSAQYASTCSRSVGARPDRPADPILVRPTLPERFHQLESGSDAGGRRFRSVRLRLSEPHVLRRQHRQPSRQLHLQLADQPVGDAHQVQL
jgi:hypothetical protein